MFLSTSLPTEGRLYFNIDLKLCIFLAFIISFCFHTENSLVLAGKTKMLAPSTSECHCFREYLCFILCLKNILTKATSVFRISG